MCIALISFASAVTIYSGESYSFKSEEFEYWDVVGNSSDMEGMNVTWEEGNITIIFDILFAPDSFTLIFFNNETQIITEHHYSSSSSSFSCSYNQDYDWECSEWSKCINWNQTRECKTYNNCLNKYGKPNETQSCLMPLIQNITIDDEELIIDQPQEDEKSNIFDNIFMALIILFSIGLIYVLIKILKGEKEESVTTEK